MEETAIRPSKKKDDEDGEEEGASSFAALTSAIGSETGWNVLWGMANRETSDPDKRVRRVVRAMMRLGLQFHERWRNVTRRYEKGALRNDWNKLHI